MFRFHQENTVESIHRDKKEGTILGGTNTERQGKPDEILIQNV